MGGKSTPNYGDLAVSQGEVNAGVVRDQTYANRPTQYTPWGYTTWTNESVIDPGTRQPTTKWTQTQGLTPELQDLLNKQISIDGSKADIAGSLVNRMGNEFNAPLNFDNLNPLGATPYAQYTMPESYEGIAAIGDPERMRARAEEAYLGKASSRLDPQFASKKQALETAMRNQGLNPEDAAWKAQMSSLGLQENDAYGQAQYDAIRAGLGEQTQLFNQDLGTRQQYVGEANDQFTQALGSNAQNFSQNLQSSNYANQIRQQQLTEEMQKRGYSLNEINALLSGGQVGLPQMPTFSNAAAAAPGQIYQAGVDQGNANAANNPMNGLMGLAGTLGAAYMGMPA